VRFQILVAISINIMTFWDVKQCCLVPQGAASENTTILILQSAK
jgi:hypothetical protein